MSVREARDRRGRPTRGSSGLLERDHHLKVIADTVAVAAQGEGRALLLEGHPGMGKTRLHEAALDQARAGGLRVLRAAGAELERNIALGVVTQLLGRLLSELPAESRATLIADAPDRVRLLAGVPARPGDTSATDRAVDLARDLQPDQHQRRDRPAASGHR